MFGLFSVALLFGDEPSRGGIFICFGRLALSCLLALLVCVDCLLCCFACFACLLGLLALLACFACVFCLLTLLLTRGLGNEPKMA